MRITARSLPCSRSGCCSFRESGLCELVHCGRCLFEEGSIAYDRSFVVGPQVWTDCYSTVNHQHSVFLLSCAIRVLSESICISYNINIELALAACRVSELSFRTRAAAHGDGCLFGRDIVYDRSTACARDVSGEKRFPKRLQNNLATYVQG